MKGLFYGKLLLSAILIFALGGISSLHADSGRAPISGTPLLREQKRLLLRDYGPAAGAQAELGGRTMRADIVGLRDPAVLSDHGDLQGYDSIELGVFLIYLRRRCGIQQGSRTVFFFNPGRHPHPVHQYDSSHGNHLFRKSPFRKFYHLADGYQGQRGGYLRLRVFRFQK
jgi:hypothetical protein